MSLDMDLPGTGAVFVDKSQSWQLSASLAVSRGGGGDHNGRLYCVPADDDDDDDEDEEETEGYGGEFLEKSTSFATRTLGAWWADEVAEERQRRRRRRSTYSFEFAAASSVAPPIMHTQRTLGDWWQDEEEEEEDELQQCGTGSGLSDAARVPTFHMDDERRRGSRVTLRDSGRSMQQDDSGRGSRMSVSYELPSSPWESPKHAKMEAQPSSAKPSGSCPSPRSLTATSPRSPSGPSMEEVKSWRRRSGVSNLKDTVTFADPPEGSTFTFGAGQPPRLPFQLGTQLGSTDEWPEPEDTEQQDEATAGDREQLEASLMLQDFSRPGWDPIWTLFPLWDEMWNRLSGACCASTRGGPPVDLDAC